MASIHLPRSRSAVCTFINVRSYRKTYVHKRFYFLFFIYFLGGSRYTYTVDGKEDICGANFKGLIIDSRLLA